MNSNTLHLRRAVFFVAFIFGVFTKVLAGGQVGYKGIYLNLNGSNSWYNIHGVPWGYSGCTNYSFYNSGNSNFGSADLGTFSTTATLQLSGFAVVGWANNGDYVAGKLEYQVWKQGDAQPNTWNVINIGNYQSPTSNASQFVCSSNDDRVVGYNNGTTNFQPGVAGTYNFRVRGYGRVQYVGGGGGWFNENNGTELTATFVIAEGPSISSTSSSVTSNSTQTYAGATITINGTNLSAVSSVKIGGSSGTSCSISSVSSSLVNAVIPNGTQGGVIWVSDGTVSSTSLESYSNLGYISTADSDWNTTSTWLGGAVPPASSVVTINHTVTVNGSVSNAPSSVTINNSKSITFGASSALTATTVTNNGSLIMTAGGTLNIASGGTLANGSSTFAYGSGTVNFLGSGTVTGTIGFNDVTLTGAVNFGTTATINGVLTLNDGGSVNTNAPSYASGSTLKYNSGTVYGRYLEWNTTSGIGYPHHVLLSNGTSLNVGNGALGVARQIGGNLTIENGSGFYMDWGTDDMTQAVTVLGNVTINSGCGLSLSDASGGGLYVRGNFTNNGTFTPKSRTVELTGSSAQTISGTMNGVLTTNNFYYLTLSNSGGGVSLSTPVVVTNTLNLNTGVVTTTSTDILHITNIAANAMVNGSSNSYISGPLRWSVSNASGGDYKFHVGKSATYLPINVNNPTGTSPVITAEAFVSNAGGTAGSGLISISPSEYWTLINTGTLSSSTISLAKSSLAGNDGVAYASALAGTYANLGGSNTSTLISNNTVTSSSSVGSLASTTYFVLATKVPAPTISSFTPSSVYVGSTITITGTNFTNVSAVSIGGVAATSYTVNSTTSISAVVAASASSGTISVTTPGGTATSSSSFTFSGYVSAAASDWNNNSTWLGGVVPPASATVTIDHAVTINGTVTDAPSSVTVNNAKALTFGANGAVTANAVTNNGSLIMTAGGTLTIAAGGTLANGSNTFTYGSGTVAFAGSGTITGTVGFNNVTLAGGVNFGTASTINGTLSINPGGFVTANAPIYASGSTLNYNAGGTYGRGTEWSSANSGVAGYPHHVQISNGTILNLGANSGAAIPRQIAGNLTVNNGATLSLAVTPMTAALTVKGNYLNYGTTLLSSAIGGDLVLEGDLTDNATFTANGRAIFFHGSNIQSIFSSDNPLDIDVARFNKSGGEVRLLQNLLIDESANPVQFAGTSTLNLNGYSATFGKANTSSSITMNSTSAIKCNSSSSLTILGNGAFGTVNFDQTTPGTSNQLGSLFIDRSTGSVTMGNNLLISGILTLTNGSLSIGANTLDCQNTVTVSSGSLCGGSSSILIFSGGNSLAELKMDNTTPGTTNLLSALTLSKTGASSAVNISANVIVNGNLSISGDATNTVNASKQLTVNGVLTNNGILTLNSGATLVQGSSSTLAGSGTYNVKQTVTGAGSGTPSGRFWYVGSPVSTATSAVYDAAGANILKYYSESANAWQEITDNTSSLEVGRGYFVQAATGTTELNFTGGTINNNTYTLNVTRNTTTNAFRGYNLLTNPYPSYLDWDNVTRSNVGTTMWYRSVNNAGVMVFDTYNAPAGTGTNNNQTGAVTRYIPPMQSFWVNVPQGQTTGTVSFGNAQRSHYSTGVQGLRSSAQDFPAFLRLNLLDGNFVDQTILYMKPDANNTFDEYDSEKMFLGGVPQFYSTVNAKKLVLNGMKNQKARTSVPLTMELPTSKSYTFQTEEFNIEDGLILLEDKQEGVIQDLTINPTYSFFGNAGTNATRFVVHFQLASAPILVGGPQELESLGSDELVSENIQIVSNNQGTIIIRMDEGFKPEGSIRIFDASGRLVEQRDFNDQETTIQLNEQAGMYFVEVNAGKLMVKKKIVIE